MYMTTGERLWGTLSAGLRTWLLIWLLTAPFGLPLVVVIFLYYIMFNAVVEIIMYISGCHNVWFTPRGSLLTGTSRKP